jgi:carbamate kinase
VGDEMVRQEAARDEASPLPLGVLVADTAGWIGYMIQQSIYNALRKARSERRVATIITQVLVDPTDDAMHDPTKFIGRGLTPERGRGARVGRLQGEGGRQQAPAPRRRQSRADFDP